MIGITGFGEKIEMDSQAGRPRGRTLSEAECRRLNDLLFDHLCRTYSAPDAHAILSVTRNLRHRYRRRQEMLEHAPELHEAIVGLAGERNAG
jgi:hypothetical protein